MGMGMGRRESDEQHLQAKRFQIPIQKEKRERGQKLIQKGLDWGVGSTPKASWDREVKESCMITMISERKEYKHQPLQQLYNGGVVRKQTRSDSIQKKEKKRGKEFLRQELPSVRVHLSAAVMRWQCFEAKTRRTREKRHAGRRINNANTEGGLETKADEWISKKLNESVRQHNLMLLRPPPNTRRKITIEKKNEVHAGPAGCEGSTEAHWHQ
jgi:hypothetical protein